MINPWNGSERWAAGARPRPVQQPGDNIVREWSPDLAISYGQSTCIRCGHRFEEGDRFRMSGYSYRPNPGGPRLRRIRLICVECPRKGV